MYGSEVWVVSTKMCYMRQVRAFWTIWNSDENTSITNNRCYRTLYEKLEWDM